MNQNINHDGTLRDLLRIIFRRKTVVLIVIVVFNLITYAMLELKSPYYVADVQMLVSAAPRIDNDQLFREFTGKLSLLQAHAILMRSESVLKRVVVALNLLDRTSDKSANDSKLKKFFMAFKKKPEKASMLHQGEDSNNLSRDQLIRNAAGELSSQIDVSTTLENEFIRISVSDPNPIMAMRIANSVSRSYMIYDLESQLTQKRTVYGDNHVVIQQLIGLIAEIEKTLHGYPLPDLEAMGVKTIKIVSQANYRLVKTNKLLTLQLSFAVSILFGIVLAFLFNITDHSFRSQEDIEKFLGIPCLGSISKTKNKLLINDASLRDAKYIRSINELSGQMYLTLKEKKIKSVLITDIDASKDTPLIVANLGLFFSQQTNSKVLIIDTNLNSSSFSSFFDVDDNRGIAEILEWRLQFEDAMQCVQPNLYIMKAGNADINSMLNSSKIDSVIIEAREHYDIILIHCADLKKSSDALILSNIVDGTVLILNAGTIKRQVAIFSISALKQSKNCNIIGAILNNREYEIPEMIYKIT